MSFNKRVIAVLGGGVIGQSWAALFASKGNRVNIFEPNKDTAKNLKPKVLNLLQDMPNTVGIDEAKGNIQVYGTIEEAVKGAYAVQEAGPERVEIKQSIFKEVEAFAPENALILSSSSGIVPSKSSVKMTNPERLVVGHPFNPPHIMPLVEVLSMERVDENYLEEVMDFYKVFERVPIKLNKEIPGFVANRLQTVVVLEAINLIEKGVVSVEQMDAIMKNSLGIRWASIGPMLTGVLGGGPGGIKHILEHILNTLAIAMGKKPVSEETIESLQEETNKIYPIEDREYLAKHRDEVQRAIIRLQKLQRHKKEMPV